MRTTGGRALEGRVAIITGASAGIGRACAEVFAEQGARLILNARRSHVLSELERQIDVSCGVETAHCVPGDCADPVVIKTMLQAAADHFDKPADLVLVNAGRGLAGSVLGSDDGHWEELVRTNLIGAARLLRTAAAEMVARRAHEDWSTTPRDIVVLGSTVGRHISPFSSMYGSTKFAVHSLAEALRRELAPRAIRVGLVEPGIVESEFQSVAGYDPVGFGELMQKMGPVLTPRDVAETIAFMCSRPARVAIGDVVIRGSRQDYP